MDLTDWCHRKTKHQLWNCFPIYRWLWSNSSNYFHGLQQHVKANIQILFSVISCFLCCSWFCCFQHPSIHPVIHALANENGGLVIRGFHKEGSLRDMICKVSWFLKYSVIVLLVK